MKAELMRNEGYEYGWDEKGSRYYSKKPGKRSAVDHNWGFMSKRVFGTNGTEDYISGN
ncbi:MULTISPECIES: hypothetical protein [Planktothricoides]|uniref:Uncharacterized protein n=1 Tax=Planktothricoides raciborskii FACHB-1370 TaxID=2949576 RepID=A0ABR8EM70_9CYAN|nr:MULTISPECIES: hypothetical protein [Planktothricoides]MBD2547776.1 hypothetical protein [Planktothricoides raciborskii FACHB-1370]